MDYTLGDVLREVNNLRFYEFSLPPLERLPKGSCRQPSTCVIARCFPRNKYGLEPYTDGDRLFYFDDGLESVLLSETIRLFITDFDNGEWPSLMEKDSEILDQLVCI